MTTRRVVDRQGSATQAEDQPVELVIVEDGREYADLVQEMLRAGWTEPVRFHHFQLLEDAHAHLRVSAAACILLDLSLPDANGLDALTELQAAAPQTPIVVLTGSDDEALGLKAVRLGAQDYLIKGRVNQELIVRSVRFAIERRRAERAHHQALHDPLTGLANRTLFFDHLELALARLQRHPVSIAVLFLDLDRFKTVNDSFGHGTGDWVLVQVAQRIGKAVRPTDTVARLGGDEFMILCEEFDADHELTIIADRMADAIAAPLTYEDRKLWVTASIGIALATSPEASPETLVRNADAAMYRAKQRHSTYELFDAPMQTRARERSELERDLRAAIDNQQFHLTYQPLIRLDNGDTYGFEALLRYDHPRRGVLEASEFIEVAESSGLTVPIGRWALGTACRQLDQWYQETGQRLQVSLNLSARQLADIRLLTTLRDALEAANAEAWQLCLEFTQAALAQDDDFTIETLRTLKSLGVTLAVDDVWTARSALSRMERLPLDLLKIDHSFVTGLARDPRKRRLVAAVIGLADALDLPVIAEGVESAEEITQLRALGCTAAQGYHLGSPQDDQPVTELAAADNLSPAPTAPTP